MIEFLSQSLNFTRGNDLLRGRSFDKITHTNGFFSYTTKPHVQKRTVISGIDYGPWVPT